MSLRGARHLPGWPAVLLVPAILGLWAALCAQPRLLTEYPYPVDAYRTGMLAWGIPFTFCGDLRQHGPDRWIYTRAFQPVPFMADLTIALAAAWTLAMAVDRLVFPFIRRRQRPDRATPPEPS